MPTALHRSDIEISSIPKDAANILVVYITGLHGIGSLRWLLHTIHLQGRIPENGRNIRIGIAILAK